MIRNEVEKPEVYSVAIISARGTIELTGTKEQHAAFEVSREAIDKILFPKFIHGDKLVGLALDCGLSVRSST